MKFTVELTKHDKRLNEKTGKTEHDIAFSIAHENGSDLYAPTTVMIDSTVEDKFAIEEAAKRVIPGQILLMCEMDVPSE